MMSNKDGNWMSKLLIKAHMELWTLEWSKGTSFSGDVGAEGGGGDHNPIICLAQGHSGKTKRPKAGSG